MGCTKELSEPKRKRHLLPSVRCAYCDIPISDVGQSRMFDLHVTSKTPTGTEKVAYIVRFGLKVLNGDDTVAVPAMSICKCCARDKGYL